MLGQQRELSRSNRLGKEQSPAGDVVAAACSRAGDGDMGRRLQDSRAKQNPAAEKILKGPVTGEKVTGYAVFVRLVAYFDSQKILAQRRDCKGNFFRRQSRGGRSQVDSVEAPPTGRLQKAGEILDVSRRDLRVGASAA